MGNKSWDYRQYILACDTQKRSILSPYPPPRYAILATKELRNVQKRLSKKMYFCCVLIWDNCTLGVLGEGPVSKKYSRGGWKKTKGVNKFISLSGVIN